MNANQWRALTLLGAAVALIVGSSPAWAQNLTPGNTLIIGSGNVVSGLGVTGTTSIVADTGWISASTPSGTGEVREIVVSGDTSNPNAGGLDFIFQLQNTSSNGVNLGTLFAQSFGSFLTNVIAANPGVSSFYNGSNLFGTPGPGGNDPAAASRSGGTGSEITFAFQSNFSDALTPGSYSDLLIVQTNATNFNQNGTLGFSDGGNSPNLTDFQPAAAPVSTPEPASVFLLAGCLAGLGVVGLRNRGRKIVPLVS